eukprot:scaffold73_cov252-Pinguiococcus_pyrenoidosus.AAC.32
MRSPVQKSSAPFTLLFPRLCFPSCASLRPRSSYGCHGEHDHELPPAAIPFLDIRTGQVLPGVSLPSWCA